MATKRQLRNLKIVRNESNRLYVFNTKTLRMFGYTAENTTGVLNKEELQMIDEVATGGGIGIERKPVRMLLRLMPSTVVQVRL